MLVEEGHQASADMAGAGRGKVIAIEIGNLVAAAVAAHAGGCRAEQPGRVEDDQIWMVARQLLKGADEGLRGRSDFGGAAR